MRTFFLSGYNNGDYDMWRVGREQTIEVRDHWSIYRKIDCFAC